MCFMSLESTYDNFLVFVLELIFYTKSNLTKSQKHKQTLNLGFLHLRFIRLHFQVVPLTAAVIVTTPQKLAFIDVAKGVRMFSKLKVCIL